jgi:guanyl-specific ribonuclease Sa
MEFALDGVDFAVAKVSALVLSSESSENAPESNPAEAAISATDIPAETPATVTPIESTQPLIPDPSIGTDEATVN